MSLTVRVGNTTITRLAEDLAYSRSLNGPATCSFTYRAPITRQLFVPFEKVYVFDGSSADLMWDGRVEDTGRSVDGEGQAWSIAAVGESARAEDRAQALTYIDTDLTRWEREQLARATSATGDASQVPTTADDGDDALLLQYPPGEPIDTGASIVMVYRSIERAGMTIGAVHYTTQAGFSTADWETRLFVKGGAVDQQQLSNAWSTTPTDRSARLGTGSPIPALTTRLELTSPRVSGGATTVSSDTAWAAFSNVIVKAALYGADGALITTTIDFYLSTRDGIYAHEVVADLIGRGLLPYDGDSAEIDDTSTHEIDQFAYPDGATPAQLLEDLAALEPNYYWQVGPENATGKPTFRWVKWPTHVRYEFSMVDGLDIPGAEAERYNRVTVRWVDRKERLHTKNYNAGNTINGVDVPEVAELLEAGPGGTKLIRQPEIQDLSDEVGSERNANKFAAEFLLQHGTPPVAGTLTVARKVYDHDLGRYVHPYEIMPGHLGRIRELADDVADLGATDRDGKSVFRVMGMDYRHDTRSATVELDAPPRTDEELLAKQIKKRNRKR